MENILLLVLGLVGVVFTVYGLIKRKYGLKDSLLMLVQVICLPIAFVYNGEPVGKVLIFIAIAAMIIELIDVLKRKNHQVR